MLRCAMRSLSPSMASQQVRPPLLKINMLVKAVQTRCPSLTPVRVCLQGCGTLAERT